MTEKPRTPPPVAKGSFVGQKMQAELDSLFQELESLDLGGGRGEVEVELEDEEEPPTTPLVAPPPVVQRLETPRPPPEPPRAPPPAPPAAPGVDPARVALLEQELEAWKSKAQRAAAEFDSIRRRLVKEKQDAVVFANEQIVRELLPVVDTLWLAVEHANPERFADLLSGVRMTVTLFLQALAKHGVEPYDARGVAFDPRIHQAISRVDTRDYPPGTVVSVAQRGFNISGRLLRPALVTVASEPATPVAAPVGDPAEAVANEPRRRRSVPDAEVGGRVTVESVRVPFRSAQPEPNAAPDSGVRPPPPSLSAPTVPHRPPAIDSSARAATTTSGGYDDAPSELDLFDSVSDTSHPA